MMIKATVLSILCVLLLNSCSHSLSYSDGKIIRYPTKDISIKKNEYEKYNYQGKKYQIIASEIKLNDPNNKWTTPEFDFNTFAKATIRNELNNIGLKQSNKPPDILVTYGFDINMAAIKIKLFDDSDGNFVLNVPKGALNVIIINQKNGDVLWAAWAKSKYKKLEESIAKKRMEYAISKMFEKLPN